MKGTFYLNLDKKSFFYHEYDIIWFMKMTKNMRILICVIVLLVILSAALFGSEYRERMSEKQARQEKIENQYGKTLHLDDETGVSKAVSIMIEEADHSLTGDYPLDEAFYYWIAAQFGHDAIVDLAYSVHQGIATEKIWRECTGESIHTLYAEYCKEKSFATYTTGNVTWPQATDNSTISVVGDLCFSNGWYTQNMLEENGGALTSVFSADLISTLNQSAVTWANNEFVYADGGTPLEGKDYIFATETKNVANLNALGIDIVSLANNHAYDYGADGVLSSMKTLRNAGIRYVGAGKDIKEAMQPQYFIVGGKKIALVAATQVEISLNYTKEATEDRAGVLKTLDPEKFVRVIQEAKANSDYVIAYVHWGWEGRLRADEAQMELARAFAKAGADVIVGNHSHRMQGATYVDGVPVIWSLGNFWLSTGSLYTAVAQITVPKSGALEVSVLPCKQSNLYTSVLKDDDQRKAFYEYFADLSYAIGIKEDGTLGFRTGEPDGSFSYYSGREYAKRTASIDLDGNAIDGVGNLR